MIILCQIYLAIAILFLAGKDATSFLLKDQNNVDNSLYYKRIDRWHRDGVALYIMFTLPLCYFVSWWIILFAVLIRLSFFDLAFNKWAGLNFKFLGSTAGADKLFSKIFGQYGAVKKSLFFLILLIFLNLVI